MQKIYNYGNVVIRVIIPETDISENLQKHTENFLRKVIKERDNNGYSNTSRNIN